jgi:signal transduction histidine kinase
VSRSSDDSRHAEAEVRCDAGTVEARLEALREFAYGAGHEINNPLANIATRAQALLLDEPDPERRRRLAAIVDQAFRARDMIGGLMVFARPPKASLAAADVGSIVAAVIEAVRPVAVARGARLEYAPPPTPLRVCVDAGHVTEALRILVLNGLEAADVGGRVAIEAARAADGLTCEVVVSDDGRGMDAATLRRAFDPFFSGREAGRGIGLGLPKAWRLLTGSGGSVDVDSRLGHGSRLTVRLPLADVRDRREPASAALLGGAESR